MAGIRHRRNPQQEENLTDDSSGDEQLDDTLPIDDVTTVKCIIATILHERDENDNDQPMSDAELERETRKRFKSQAVPSKAKITKVLFQPILQEAINNGLDSDLFEGDDEGHLTLKQTKQRSSEQYRGVSSKLERENQKLHRRIKNSQNISDVNGESIEYEHKLDDSTDNITRDTEKANLYPFIGYGVMMILIIFLGGFLAWYTDDNNLGIRISWNHVYRDPESYLNSVKSMKKYLKSQDAFFWKSIENTGGNHMTRVYNEEKEDLRPLAFLIAGYDKQLSGCFVTKLAKAFTPEKFITLDANSYVNLEPQAAKLRLDTDVRHALKDKQKVVVVKDIDVLDFEAAALFMSYADANSDMNDFPQLTMLLTMQIPDVGAVAYKSELHSVERHFKKVFASADMDRVAPLWSRVGDGTVVLRNEADRRICD